MEKAKRRFTLFELYATFCFITVMSFTLDGIFGGSLSLYYYFDKGVEIRDIISQLITGIIGTMIYFFMPDDNRKWLIYFFIAIVFSVCFEKLIVMIGVLTYISWKFTYSIPVYIIGLIYLRFQRKYIIKRTNRE